MNESSPLWREIAPPVHDGEAQALAFVRAGLPDYEPYRAWSNLEFLAEDGSPAEVDLLVVAPRGVFLVEIKSWPGRVEGDATTWRVSQPSGVRFEDNPLLLANRKAKKLASLLRRQKALRGQALFIEPLVFLAHPGVGCQLAGSAAQGVYLRDRPDSPGIRAALTAPPPAGRPRVDRVLSRGFATALEQAGIRPTQRARRAGDFLLDELLGEGPGWQDWLAHHGRSTKVKRRVRLFSPPPAAGQEARVQLERSVQRELEALDGVRHAGVERPLTLVTTDRGPGLVFEHEPKAQRLDHFLRARGRELSFDQRLRLLRQVGEILQFCHEQRLYHRALSPTSIRVVDPAAEGLQLRLRDWQTAQHPGPSTTLPERLTGVTELLPLVAPEAEVYVAPEAVGLADADPVTLDVFSLGAVAFLILTGQPPAGTASERDEHLRRGPGLQLAAAMDGAHRSLSEVVALATHPVVSSRLASVQEFLEFLELAEEDLTRDLEAPVADPLQARKGDRLAGGFRVLEKLGQGSSAAVFRVEREGRTQVLKLALDAKAEQRLRDEAEVLRKLDHETIVKLEGTVEIGERFGLLLTWADGGTLARRLRDEGRLQDELLQRFGTDLLQAVRYLEKRGVPHRDLKPDNLGVVKRDALRLVLFDFSLSRARPENIQAGTRPYLEPFLKERGRWDLHAERYAAAVTLYEMAVGALPQWGDGRTDPAFVTDAVRIEAELLPGAVREPLGEFFRRALARRPEDRFDNAEEMLSAWRQAFAASEGATTESATEAGGSAWEDALAAARMDTVIELLGLSTRATNALERAGVATVRELLCLPLFRVNRLRGVGSKTRKELVEAIHHLSLRLGRPTAVEEPPATPAEVLEEAASPSLDRLVSRFLVTARKEGSTERRALELLLGFGAAEELPRWPSQTEVAAALGVTRARVSQILTGARERWRRDGALARLGDDVADALERTGRVSTADELALALLARRGSVKEEPERGQVAAANLRVALEIEAGAAAPRWRTRRSEGRLLVALEGPAAAEEVLDWAASLGRRADLLVHEDPLPSPQRARERLLGLVRPEALPALAPERLLRLAAAASRGAELSSRLELYPRGLAAERALRLASGALLGARRLRVEEVHSRVASRFPAAQRLPGRPELDDLLTAAGLGLVWSLEGEYVFPEFGGSLGGSSSTFQRTTLVPEGETAPEVVRARELDRRLARAAREGAFLVLLVEPPEFLAVEAGLAERFPVEPVYLEARWLAAMRRLAAENEVDWPRVVAADGFPPDHPEAQHLRRFARAALAEVEAELVTAERTVLLSRAGLLARWGEVAMLERLRERVVRRPAAGERALPGLWLLTVVEAQAVGPEIEGTPVPTLTPAQWAKVPAGWARLPREEAR